MHMVYGGDKYYIRLYFKNNNENHNKKVLVIFGWIDTEKKEPKTIEPIHHEIIKDIESNRCQRA